MSSLCRNLNYKLSRCFACSRSISKKKKTGTRIAGRLTRRSELAGSKRVSLKRLYTRHSNEPHAESFPGVRNSPFPRRCSPVKGYIVSGSGIRWLLRPGRCDLSIVG
ncbi:hypothetical protein EPR50_G00154950 [Perca flavescens]|uniref:Uncharacterized protein n=1 Tax=Perca flavescens TaxID=8167 RepID=A0A484CFP4_PERFV|nr:hypothetical protein EPR50_G00154950 [Perca flavescens]